MRLTPTDGATNNDDNDDNDDNVAGILARTSGKRRAAAEPCYSGSSTGMTSQQQTTWTADADDADNTTRQIDRLAHGAGERRSTNRGFDSLCAHIVH